MSEEVSYTSAPHVSPFWFVDRDIGTEAHASAIINPPISLAPELATLLTPELDIKVKHGVIGLLKHLSQSPTNRPLLGEARIIQQLAACEIWSDKADMVSLVQTAAIGVAKHLCHSNGKFFTLSRCVTNKEI